MIEIFNKLRDSHDLLFKAFLLLLSLVSLVFLLPKEAKFQYEFRQGKPWLHSGLLAPFDFAVYKTTDELQAEQKQVTSTVHHYFKLDPSIGKKQIAKFNEAAASNADTSDNTIKKKWTIFQKTGESLLQEIYNHGVLKPEKTSYKINASSLVSVVVDNVAKEQEFGELLSIASSYELIQPRLQYLEKTDQEELKSFLIGYVTYNTFYDSLRTAKVLEERLKDILPVRGMIEKDELIISKGQVVDAVSNQKLISLKKEYERRKGGDKNFYLMVLGQLLLVGMVLFALVLFLSLFRQNIINEANRVVFILVTFTLTVSMGFLPLYFPEIPMYILPFCLLPIIIKSFYDEILAAFVHVLAMLLVAFVAPNGFEFLYLQLVAGFVAIFSLATMRKRSQLLTTVLIIFGAYAISDMAMLFMREGDWQNIKFQNLYWFGASATLTLLAYPLIYLYEKTFGFLSDVSLMEMADTNSPLLRELATAAPGTFQHSLQVANLAEQAILTIGGDPLLMRTGAMYHDIGKLSNPQYFIENQVGGINPHDDLGPEESARIIIGHVLKGIEMAKKNKLPEVLIDFIRTHHGTSTVRYFLHQYKEEYGEENTDDDVFRYPGPKPFSKETAVLMMADACEAAARSLKTYNSESISALVDGLIDSQAAEKQFDNADITFKDISMTKKIFKKMLLNIYHVRIEYPK